jgi:hypothetical protein
VGRSHGFLTNGDERALPTTWMEEDMSDKHAQDADKIVQALIDTRKEVGRDHLKNLVQMAIAADGRVVSGSYDPIDGDWCGTGVKFHWPPPPHIWDLITKVIAVGGRVEVFPYGIPVPEEIIVNLQVKGLAQR